MKRKKEGTLHEAVYSATAGDDFFDVIAHALPAFADAEDFIAKATTLARRTEAPADSLRGEFASGLRRRVGRLRRWLRSGTNPGAIDDAVCAALLLAALCGEIREDSKIRPIRTRSGKVTRGKITRAAYVEAKQETGGKKLAMAKRLGVSERGLRGWERRNLT